MPIYINYDCSISNECRKEVETSTPVGSCQNNNETNIKKILHNQVRYSSSLYTNNIATITSGKNQCNIKSTPSDRNTNTPGVDIKNNSYHRYLAKKKAPHLLKNLIKFSNQAENCQ
tara:strand:- start:3222 stop:3569 length:348 start_codon:yes stop_codon:yes gene_type:complete